MWLTDQLVAQVCEQLGSRPRILVAFDGPDAAGKTTLADALTRAFAVPVVRGSIEGFHHPRDIRMRRGELSAEGYYRDSFDYELLARMLLDPLAAGSPTVQTRAYDWRDDRAAGGADTPVPEVALLVFDGVFLLRPELRDRWDTTVYLHIEPAETLRRATARDLDVFGSLDVVHQRYRQRYIPGQALYRHEADPRSFADFVIDNTDPAAPAVLKAPGP